MLIRVLLASQHGFAAAEPVLAELEEARRSLAGEGIELSPMLLDDPAYVGSPPAAWRAGLRAALHEGADVVITLDADGQHDPRQIPDLVHAHLAQGSGITIGSRWCTGGASPGTGAARSMLSRVGNWLVKAITGARGVSDSTTSFRVYSPDAAHVLLDEPLPTGTYGFFSAMVAVVQARGFLVTEVPIVFRPRYAGPVALQAADLVEFARSLPAIRRHVRRVRRDMRTNQALWAQRNPRLRAQAAAGGSMFGAIDELATLADADRFLRWIADTLSPHLGDEVLEVGAGVGAIAQRLEAAGHCVTAIEPAANVYPELERRTADHPGITTRAVTSQELLSDPSNPQFDSVVYVSVLEHILDDVAELRTARALLRPGGTVAVFVPAMPSLYGSLDFKSGHYRRYDREMLQNAVHDAGLELVDLHHMDLLGALPYFLMYRVLGVNTLDSGSSTLYDRCIVPVSRFIETHVGAPARGKNLVAVARRPLA